MYGACCLVSEAIFRCVACKSPIIDGLAGWLPWLAASLTHHTKLVKTNTDKLQISHMMQRPEFASGVGNRTSESKKDPVNSIQEPLILHVLSSPYSYDHGHRTIMYVPSAIDSFVFVFVVGWLNKCCLVGR